MEVNDAFFENFLIITINALILAQIISLQYIFNTRSSSLILIYCRIIKKKKNSYWYSTHPTNHSYRSEDKPGSRLASLYITVERASYPAGCTALRGFVLPNLWVDVERRGDGVERGEHFGKIRQQGRQNLQRRKIAGVTHRRSHG